jgi:hypothetical protein
MRAGFFHQGGNKAYMPKKVPNTQRIINTVILKIVNIVFSGWGQLPVTIYTVYSTVAVTIYTVYSTLWNV